MNKLFYLHPLTNLIEKKHRSFLIAQSIFWVLWVSLAGCSSDTTLSFLGTVEGEWVEVSSPIGGTLENLWVREGEKITKGDKLFWLEKTKEAAALREALEKHTLAKAKYDNLQKGKRPEEIAIINAKLQAALSEKDYAKKQYQRYSLLSAKHFESQQKLDEARALLEQQSAQVDALKAELTAANLPARSDEITAAKAEVNLQLAALDQIKWALSQKNIVSPLTGLVSQTYFLPGEWVPPGAPVLSILAPENIKIRFFVPEFQIPALKIGQPLQITCDGCQSNILAKLSYISPNVEFTPPVIYSQTERHKLVFLVEAKPDNALESLHPGQPVQVTLIRP